MWNKKLDAQLKELAIKAQQHPPQSKQRQIALTRLVRAIRQSGQLCRPFSGQFRGFYSDIYDEACNQVFLYLCKNIACYDPQREVLQWVNFLLKKRFLDAARFILQNQGYIRYLKEREERDRIESLPAHPVNPWLLEEIIAWIETDPDRIFQQTHVVGCPDANFRNLALKRIEGHSWKTLSKDLNISIKTLSCFHNRCLIKFAPKLKDYVQST